MLFRSNDVNLFKFADDVDAAFTYLRDDLTAHYLGGEPEPETPAIAKSRV